MGRERETEEVKSQLAMTRLLTLTGVGGSGKTRLALEVARDLVAAYPDGAWFVELAALSEEALVPKAAAEALELPERPAEPLADTLSEALRDRQLLLILDNCEHLLEASARLVTSCWTRAHGCGYSPLAAKGWEWRERSGGLCLRSQCLSLRVCPHRRS